MMINAGGGGFNMIYPLYGPFNRFANVVQRPSRYDADPPQWNPDVITNLEMADRAVRQQMGYRIWPHHDEVRLKS